MKSRLALMLIVLLPILAACSKQEGAVPASETAPAVQAPAATETPAATPAPAPTEPASEVASANTNSVTAPAGPTLVPGVDYVEIQGGQPFDPLNGKIEVTEVFGYVCPACNAFQPLIRSWKAKLPADVRLTYVPALFGPDWLPYAHAFYAAESLGLVEKTHDAVYNEIHAQNSLPGEGDKPTAPPIAAFYAKYGVSAEQFANTMNSFAINGKINKAKQYALRSQISGTPTLIVNGKYRVVGKSFEDMLRIADHLIAQERAAQAGAAK
ncbi:MAG TPA: thiol:disulfide interchange protein DsbA/DsbL [Pseudoxanthomonas sp.]